MIPIVYRIQKDGIWLVVSEEEWNVFPGLRMLLDLEYHGPCYVSGTERPSRVVRECRCNTCTLFEEGRVLSPAVQQAVDFMLRDVSVAQRIKASVS